MECLEQVGGHTRGSGFAQFCCFLMEWKVRPVLLGFLLHSVTETIHRYRTMADRLVSMRLVSAKNLTNRQVSYEFMNRQMVWHSFTVKS